MDTQTKMTESKFSTKQLLPLILLLMVTAGVYGQTLSYDFVTYDDDLYVLHPQNIGWWSLSLKEKLLTSHIGYPIPVVSALYGMITKFLGLTPFPFHAANLAVHIFNVVLVYLLARRLDLDSLGAAAITSLWAFHPIIAEPVSWVTGMKELLMLTGSMIALHGALFSYLGDKRWNLPLMGLGFVIALGSKPTAVVLGPVIAVLLFLVWKQQLAKDSLRPAAIAAFVMTILGLAHAFLTKQMHTDFGGHVEANPLSRMVAAAHVQFQNLLIPLGLGPTYAYSPPDVAAYLSVLGVSVGALVLFVWAARTERIWVAFGIAWMVAFYLPVSNVLPVSRFTADSYVYAPLFGLVLLLSSFFKRRENNVPVYIALLFSAFLAFGSFHQSQIWSNGIALWQRATVMGGEEGKDFHYFKLAQALAFYGYWQEAVESYEKANTNLYGRGIPFDPRWPYAYWKIGDPETAEKLFQEGLRRIPPPRTPRDQAELDDFNRHYQLFLQERGGS